MGRMIIKLKHACAIRARRTLIAASHTSVCAHHKRVMCTQCGSLHYAILIFFMLLFRVALRTEIHRYGDRKSAKKLNFLFFLPDYLAVKTHCSIELDELHLSVCFCDFSRELFASVGVRNAQIATFGTNTFFACIRRIWRRNELIRISKDAE